MSSHHSFTFTKELLELLIAAGARIDDKNKEGWSAAHFAAQQKDDPKCLQVLIKHKCDVNSACVTGVNVLMTAASNDAKEAARVLIEAGARTGDKDNKVRRETRVKFV